MVKNPPANARDIRDAGSIPRLGRYPRGGAGALGRPRGMVWGGRREEGLEQKFV